MATDQQGILVTGNNNLQGNAVGTVIQPGTTAKNKLNYDLAGYFTADHKDGDTIDWAGGKLRWNGATGPNSSGYATYTNADGTTATLTQSMTAAEIAKSNAHVSDFWDKQYGLTGAESYVKGNHFEQMLGQGQPSGNTATAPNQVNTGSGGTSSNLAGATGGAVPGSTVGLVNNSLVNGYNPTLRTVQGDDLVQNQLGRILANGSPLIDQAQAKAMQVANARGLVNSSLAAQSGSEAAIGAALPIATTDANTNFQQGITNQNASNTASQFNAGALNTANLTQMQIDAQKARDAANNAFSATESAKTREQNQKQFESSQALAREQLSNNQFNQYTGLYMGILDSQDSQETKQTKIQHLNSLYFGKGFTPSSGTAGQLQNTLPVAGGGTTATPAPTPPSGGNSTPKPQEGQKITVGGQEGVVVYDMAGKPYLQTADGSYYELQNG